MMTLPHFRVLSFLLVAGSVALACQIHAELRPADLFSDHAVLQQGRPVPIWGTARSGEKITIRYRDEVVTTEAGADGIWKVDLPALSPGDPAPLHFEGDSRHISQDVVVGDVWLCSGQSNMEWPVARADLMEERMQAGFPLIRQFKITPAASETPSEAVTGKWVVCSPQTVGGFSAVGYAFAKRLFQDVGTPQGILNCSWGGTPIEAWLAPRLIDTNPAFQIARERWKKYLEEEYPAKLAQYETDLAAWKNRPAGSTEKPPREPNGPLSRGTISGAYNAMLAPLVPYALRGILWYQGEQNTGRPQEYGPMLKALIRDWRSRWQDDHLPFFIVQLPNFGANAPEGQNWAQLRAQQAAALELPHTAMAVTIDVGDPADVHPTGKKIVGERLALLALDRCYQQALTSQGPRPDGAVVDGSRVIVKFPAEANPIVLKPAVPGALSFELGGNDGRFFPAAVSREKGNLVLQSPQVRRPTRVRYCWRNAPAAILFNEAGLPAPPFELKVAD